jgi:hypothetical protein
MMPTPVLDTHGNTHRLYWLLPDSAAACLATPDCCAITTKSPVAQNARCSIVLQPTFPLRGKTGLAAASRHHRRT